MIQKMIGVACLVVGIILLIQGHNISQAVGSQIVHTFTGETPEKARNLYIAGAVACVAGGFCIFWSSRRGS